jgi:fructose 1,6-bisphosphatase
MNNELMNSELANAELMDALTDAANNLFWDFQDFTEIEDTIEATGDDLAGVNLKEVKDRAWNAFMAASAVLKKHRENKS